MNRTEREYCSKGKHPAWRAWKAKYSSGHLPSLTQRHIGNFCIYCGSMVDDVIPDIPQRIANKMRLNVLRGISLPVQKY